MTGNYLRNKFTIHKSLAHSTVRGIFFSKYSERRFDLQWDMDETVKAGFVAH